MTDKFHYVHLPNVGYLQANLTDEELLPVRNEIADIQNNFESDSNEKANIHLAGNIKREFLLKKSLNHIEKLIQPYIQEYDKLFNYTNAISDLALDKCWVNFQKKHEFNPIHNHSGIMAFVIWMEIPYDDKEIDIDISSSSSLPSAGTFDFYYTMTHGLPRVYKIPISKEYVNKMILFPSTFMHQVYPFFTSDEYRISISGNFVF